MVRTRPRTAPLKCREIASDEVTRQCTDLWDRLQAGAVAEVPLDVRCQLIRTLAAAAIDALNIAGSRWRPMDVDARHLAVLVGADERSVILGTEQCPRAHASRFYYAQGSPSTVEVDMLGSDAVAPDITLRLTDQRSSECPCAAVFEWQFVEDPAEASAVPTSTPAPEVTPRIAPTLAVAISTISGREFNVVRTSLEFR